MANDNANFTPSFKGYTGQEPFRFWCQTVLPLVYDESLSYYELLNKVVVYLNNVISDVGNMETNVDRLLTAYTQLQNYVNEYFNNLDVQQAIDNKLDEMVVDGTFDEIINNELFSSFNERLETAENSITTLANNKRGKTDTDYITMNMLTQEVKTAMTGGSVPVVGADSIASVNIQNNAVTPQKIVNSALPVILNASPSSTITIDETNKTITLSNNFYFICGGRSITMDGSPTVSYSDEGVFWITISPDNLSSIQLETTRTIYNYVIGKIVNGVFAFVPGAKVIYTDRLELNERGTIADIRFIDAIEINFNLSKVVIPRNYNLILSVYGKYIVLNTTDSTGENYQEDLDFLTSTNFMCIAFDTTTKKLTLVRSDANISERYIPVGFLNKLNKQCSCIINYKVVGQSDFELNERGTIADIRFSGEIEINFNLSKVVIPRNNNLILSVYGKYVVLNTTDSTGENYQEDLDFLTTTNFMCIAFDTTTKKLTLVRSDATISERYIPIGFLNKLNKQCSCILNYKVVGQSNFELNERGTIADIRFSGEIEINFNLSKVIIPRNYNLTLSVYGKYVVINTTDSTAENYQKDLDFLTSTNFMCIAFDTTTKKLTLVRSNATISERYIPIGFLNKLNKQCSCILNYKVVGQSNFELNERGTIADIRFSGEIEINFNLSKVVIPRNYNLILSVYGRYVVLNTTDSTAEDYQEDLDFSTSTNFICIAFDTTTKKLTLVRSDASIDERYIPIGFLNKLNKQCSCILNYKVVGQSDFELNNVGCISDIRINGRIIFDFQREKVIMPRDNNIIISVYGKYVVLNTTDSTAEDYQEDLDFVSDFNCLGFDTQTKQFVVVNSSSNVTITNNIIPIAFFNTINNTVLSTFPYSIISKLETLNASVFEIAVFGDSITAGAGSQHPYVEIVDKLSGYRLLNYGIGECGYVVNSSTDSQHIVGQGIPKRGERQNVSEITNIKDRVANYIAQTDSADVIFLYAGSNDVANNVDSTTFTQAVDTTIESVINAGKAVGVVGILRRNFTATEHLEKLIQYNEILKQRAEYYGVPFLNLLDNGMNPVNEANRNKYFYDNAHPNDEGYVKLSYKFIDFIKKYFCYKNDI